MSMDLNFWKYKEDTAHDHSTVYQTACCDGEVMEVLEVLPIDEILKKVADSFSDWNIQGGFGCFTTLEISLRAIARGFESLPLRQNSRPDLPAGCFFIALHSKL